MTAPLSHPVPQKGTGSGDLVLASDPVGSLERLDPTARELAVTQYLTDARDRLGFALEATGPEAVAAIAAIKAEMATASEATKQLNLAKEIQSDAQEMVRRCEYALAKKIREGQSQGDIETPAEAARRATLIREVNQGRADRSHLEDSIKTRPLDFASKSELHGNGRTAVGIYALTDGVTDAQFDAALSDARAEGNLSRANVVRKIKDVKNDGLTPVEKLVKVRELAPKGMTSSQIAKEIGCGEDYVRRLARDNGIKIVADVAVNGSRRVDSNLIVAGTVEAAAVPTSTLELVDYSALDRARIGEWISSLSESIKTLRALRSRLEKELHP